MAKLGSKKHPAVVRVQTEERGYEIFNMCTENGWEIIMGIEPDEPEDISDFERLMNPLKPFHANKTTNRNDPCPCGSGKKYKKCCQDK